MSQEYRRVCVTRCGYAIVPGNTDEEAINNAAALDESSFDWEPMDADMIRDTVSVVEACANPAGSPLPHKED